MPAEPASITEGEEPPVPVGRRLLRQTILSSYLSSELAPPPLEHISIGERDQDVTARNATQLRERIIDRVHVLEHVERDHDVSVAIGKWNRFVEVGHDVGRRLEVKADVAKGPSS